MNALRWFWWLLTMACLVWYATVTVYVAVRGSFDIRRMLARLARNAEEDAADCQQETSRTDRSGS